MPAPKLDLRSQVIELLLEQGVLPGDRLYESRIAKALGVSRKPVRNALDQLCEDGLVEVVLQKGYVLRDPLEPQLAKTLTAERTQLESCYLDIAFDLFDGKLPLNITEQELLRRYDVAPALLARALGQAMTEGWAQKNPGYGWTFTDVLRRPEAYAEMMRFRAAFEPECLRSIDVEEHAAALTDLRERLHRQRGLAVGDMSADELFKMGCEFHETLIRLSGNSFALDTLRRLNALRRLFVYRAHVPKPNYITEQVEEHLAILKILRDGDADGAALAMRHHLLSAR